MIQNLKEKAIAKGLCFPWQAKLTNNLSVAALVKMYIKGIDFCISNDFPDLPFLRDNFKGKSEPYGVFIDETIVMSNKPDIVLNGNCKADLLYDGYSVSRLFIRHDSVVGIYVCGNALVTIDVFDNAILNISAAENCKVIVSVYGKAMVDIKHEKTARIVATQMNKETY